MAYKIVGTEVSSVEIAAYIRPNGDVVLTGTNERMSQPPDLIALTIRNYTFVLEYITYRGKKYDFIGAIFDAGEFDPDKPMCHLTYC